VGHCASADCRVPFPGMTPGLERPPRWAVAVLVAGVVLLTVGLSVAFGRGRVPQERTEPLQVAWIGDSYMQGPPPGFPKQVGDALGFPVDPEHPGLFSVVGGTGYIAANNDGGRPFGERIDPVIAARPNLIVIAGGLNEGRYPPAEVGAAAAAVFARLRNELPETRIVVVGPWNPPNAGDQIPQVRDAIFDAAAANGITDLVDPLPWEVEVGSDGTHPAEIGQRQIAEHLTEALRPIVSALTSPASAATSPPSG
jgi:lysophospholipase L1-like esterase